MLLLKGKVSKEEKYGKNYKYFDFSKAITDINALDPVSDGGEGPLAGHVVQQHHPVRPPEVGLGHTPEPAHRYAIIPIK